MVAIVVEMTRKGPMMTVLATMLTLTACSRPNEPRSAAADASIKAPRADQPPGRESGDTAAPTPHGTAEADLPTTTPASAEARSEAIKPAPGSAAEGAGDSSDDARAITPPAPPPYVDRLINYDDTRRALTVEYRRLHEGGEPHDVHIEPRLIVLHHTGGSSVDAAWRYFNRPKIESGRKTLAKAGDVNVGAQFLVDRDGTIFRLMPENWHARHCVGLNHLAIGVENVGDGKEHPLTAAQIEANAALVRYLAATYPITHVIGHNEANSMREHPYFHEEVAGYKTRKGDPGTAFMAAVRERIEDLKLAGPPEAPVKKSK